jgi:hypothetical protein
MNIAKLSQARQARIITTAGSLDANTMGAYRGGDFEILDFSSNGLLLKVFILLLPEFSCFAGLSSFSMSLSDA